MMTTPITLSSVPTAKRVKTSAHLRTCSHSGALKTRYDASETLRKAIKSHVTSLSRMKAIRCWTKDPSQPPTDNVGILCTQTDLNRAIENQTEIAWLQICRVSIDWAGDMPISKKRRQHIPAKPFLPT